MRYCRCGCGLEIPAERRSGRKRIWATDNCRKRFWDEANGRFCSDCGIAWLNARPVRAAARAGRAGRCNDCRLAHDRWGHERRVELVAGMYEDGWPLREIAAVFPTGQFARYEHPGHRISSLLDEARRMGMVAYRYNGYETAT